MASKKPAQDRREAVVRFEQRLAELELELEALEKERQMVQTELETLRRELTICPKCGRDKAFLTDEGGVLIHVLEDPDDTELLSPGKPLYCPTCGEVFLYAGPVPATPVKLPPIRTPTPRVRAVHRQA